MLFLGSLLSIVVECKSNHTSQRNIVATFMKYLDPEYPEEDHEVSTNIAGGKKNPGDYVMQGVADLSPMQYQEMVNYFSDNVLPLLKENDIGIVTKAIYLLIKEDTGIDDETVVEIISGTKKKDLIIKPDCLATFLAGVFIYTLKNTSNKQKTGFAKQEAKKYIELAKTFNCPDLEKKCEDVRSNTMTAAQIRLFNGNLYSSTGVAILLQKWKEKNQFDISCIESLTGKVYTDVYEDLRVQNEIAINRKESEVNCLSEIVLRDRLIEEIDEEHITILFTAIRTAVTKCSVYEVTDGIVLEGICDFLAYMGCNIRNSLRVEENRWNTLFFEWILEILKSERLTECFANCLPIIAEANPLSFLEAIDEQIYDDGIVNEDFLGDRSVVLYPLAYALRKTATYRRYFAGAMSLLFDLSEKSNIFFDNMRYVLIPFYPQTEALLQNRIGILKNFFMRDDDTAWKLLISILPGYSQSTSRRIEFRYYPIQIQEVSKEEYGQAVEQYIKLACMKIEHRVDRALDLVRICPVLSDSMVNAIAEAVIKEIPPSGNTVGLLDMIRHYQVDFINAEGKRTAFSKLQRQYETNQEVLSVRDFFKAPYGRERDEALEPKAEAYILSKYKQGGFEELLDGFAKYEDIYYYGAVIRRALMENEFRVFCYYLAERDLRSELRVLVSSLKSEELVLLFDQTHPEYYKILRSHICDSFMLDYAKDFSREISQYYWSDVKQIDIRDFDANHFKQLIDYLIQAENYETAFRALSIRIDYEEVDNNQVIQALQQYSSLKCFSDFEIAPSILYIIREVVSYILNSSVSEDVLTDLEEKYIRFFDMRYEPKHVLFKMASNPQYVENLLLCKHQKEREGEYNSSETYLISKFKVAPGYKADGSFDYSEYINWYEYALKSELSDEMLRIFAKNSYHAPAIEGDAFFMNREIAEFIEGCFNSNFMTIFEVEALNSIGSVNIDPKLHAYENMNRDFEEKAELCEIEGFIKMSRVFRSIANMMLLQAERMRQ